MTAAKGSTEAGRGEHRTRTCVSCRKAEASGELVRWVLGPDGDVVPDLSGRQFGRGAWSHGSAGCLRGLSKALAKSFKAPINLKDEQLAALLGAAATHRSWQILGAARRQKLLACGSGAVREAVSRGQASLVLVARDAQAAAKTPEVEQMVRQGQACAWATKDELGKLCGRAEIGVLAVLDLRLAQRLFGAIAMAPRGSGIVDESAPDPQEIYVLTEVE